MPCTFYMINFYCCMPQLFNKNQCLIKERVCNMRQLLQNSSTTKQGGGIETGTDFIPKTDA